METMNSPKKPGIMAQLRNRKGFSLVEMAIVLVIIGIIIGAIIKGQDLISNSRAKQVASAVSSWRNLAMAFLDRNGRLPGDGGKTGIIVAQATYSSATKEIKRTMTTTPENPLTIGSLTFYTYFGNTKGDTTGRNVIVICSSIDCQTAFTPDELEIIKSVDTAFDGSADSGIGQFRGATAAVTVFGGYAGYSDAATPPTAVPIVLESSITPGVSATWEKVPYYAAVWAFDRPY